jgi:hypothetical protein
MMIKMRNKQHSPVQQCTKNKNKEGEMTEAWMQFIKDPVNNLKIKRVTEMFVWGYCNPVYENVHMVIVILEKYLDI